MPNDYIDQIKLTNNTVVDIKDTVSGYITSASVPSASSTTPKMDGTAAVGTETAFARGDHVHPTDTSRASLDIVAPEWAPNVDYWEWDSVIYQGQLYFCHEAHVSSSTWDSSKWTPITVGGLAYILMSEKIDDPSTKTSGQFLKYNGTTWVAGDVPEGSAASSTTPKMDGTASTGSENAFARGDHVHPTDTSRQTKITASGILKGNGSGTVTAATAGTDYQAPLTFDGTYSASTNKAATVSTVTNAINALDGGTIGTGSTTKTITSLSQSNGNVSATFSDIAFPVTSVNGSTGAVTTAEKFVIAATAISGTEYYNLDKTYADILNAIGGNKYVSIQDMDATYPYTTITTQGIVFGATLLATSNGQLMAITDGILVVQPDSGTNAMGMAVHSSTVLPTISDIPSASSTTPSMDGTAAVGTGTTWARADHVHPTDTSRQATLVSGTNIKTINNESILGSGNISISAGSSDVFIVEYGTTTYAEISTALNGNKLLFCHVSWNDIVCPYIGVVNSQYAFSNLGAGESTVSLYVNSSNTWSYATSNLATKITASGILKGDGSGGVTAATAGTDYQAPISFDGTYSSSNKAATVSTVTNAINALDGGTIGTGGTTKTITSLSQTNGNVSATFSDIAFPTEILTVTATRGASPSLLISADVTYADIYAAMVAGKTVIVKFLETAGSTVYGYFYPVGYPYYSGDTLYFSHAEPNTGRTECLSVTSSDFWQFDYLALAPKASPTFTGTPKAPTAAAGTNTTQIATTAFVQGELADYSPLTANNAIASNADLNSLTAPGDYYANTPTARTLSNTPYGDQSNSAMAFVLKVVRTLGAASSVFLRQELVEYTIPSVGANIWVRYSTNSGSAWSDWAKIPTEHQTITGVNRGGYANANGGKYVIFAKVKKSTSTQALAANQYIVGNANNVTVGNKGIYLLNITNRNNVFSMIVRKIMPDYGTVTFGYYSTTENGVDYWNIGVASTSGYSSIPSVFCINEGEPSSTHRVELLGEPTILDSAPTGWTAVSMDVVATTADIDTAIGSAILASY